LYHCCYHNISLGRAIVLHTYLLSISILSQTREPTVLYTLDYTLDQQDRIDAGLPIRIIHILLDDEVTVEDRYYVLIDCDSRVYTLLNLL